MGAQTVKAVTEHPPTDCHLESRNTRTSAAQEGRVGPVAVLRAMRVSASFTPADSMSQLHRAAHAPTPLKKPIGARRRRLIEANRLRTQRPRLQWLVPPARSVRWMEHRPPTW